MEQAENIIRLLSYLNYKIATAESCTGGRIAAALTAIPGASKVVQGGVVSYQNEIKIKLLHVKEDTITQNDVVSEQVAIEMMLGACVQLDADIAIATTGYVGPTGGSELVPLGTVWIACGNGNKYISKNLYVDNSREENLCRVVSDSLCLINQFIHLVTEENKLIN